MQNFSYALRRPCLLHRPMQQGFRARGRYLHLAKSAKMYLPSDGFQGMSPEKKMATNMRTFFTFAACRIVLAQLEGSGRGSEGAYDADGYQNLSQMLHEIPMKDGDEWLLELMQKNYNVGVRVLDVRKAYCQDDFEWDQCERLAKTGMQVANTSLLRKFAAETLEARMKPSDVPAENQDR